jgi:hypothetical protein
VLAALAWVHDTWYTEVALGVRRGLPAGRRARRAARRHAVYCRGDNTRMMVALRIELGSPDHPVGAAVRAHR